MKSEKPMKSISQLLANNEAWAQKCVNENPNYFKDLVGIQQPQYLWIGCSDARVPANTIVGLNPGEVFVHRNIANQIRASDLNCMSVVQFAVEFLQVKDILVCGHYGCGGVKGALENKSLGIIDNWLVHIKDLSALHKAELDAIPDFNMKLNRLCEINTHQQVINLSRVKCVQDAWTEGRPLAIHGFIYDLHDGLLKSLDLCISSKEDAENLN